MEFTGVYIGLVCLFAASINCNDDTTPLISIKDGLIRGSYKESAGGRRYIAFEGVPFAQPPIGDLRFEDPRPVKPWTGILDATTTYACMQVAREIMGQEDCLYLNVYVPREKINPKDNLDVVVHIHGGAFVLGTPSMAGPGFLMDEEVVYVTMNYRLGVFGFYSTGNGVSNGNFGLKDQTLALKWIQNNIDQFGGNKDSVTITGLSAGGTSVHLHYFSANSKGLFHRGFAQSGSALVPWAIRKNPEIKARSISDGVGCPWRDIQCLKQRPAKQIMDVISKTGGAMMSPYFGPTLEPDSPTSFLSEMPYSQYISNKVLDVPLMFSIVSEEGTISCGYFYGRFSDLDRGWNSLMPSLLAYDDHENKDEISAKIREFYLGDEPVTSENFHKIIKLCGERTFNVGCEKSAKLQANLGESNVYFAVINYGGRGVPLPSSGITADLGVGHGIDGRFYYEGFPMGPPDLDETETKMKDILVDLMVSFAKTGVPTVEGLNFEPLSKSGDFKYLLVKSPEDISFKIEPTFSDAEFWASLRFKEDENLI